MEKHASSDRRQNRRANADSSDKRSEAAKKGWVTRRRNAAKRS